VIRVYTKERHISKIKQFLESLNLKNEIYTIKDNPLDSNFDLGISYCYPRKIKEPLLSTPSKGFINFHPAPLPKYKGPTELDEAIKNKEMRWGVTVHHMDENYDTGKIIKIKKIDLHEPPTALQELGAVSHYFLFQLFKETILNIYNGNLK
jgi:methionyl-tRNA formyltransferase